MFAASFQPTASVKLPAELASHLNEIDALIAKAAPEWPISQISKVDLAILRVGVLELLQRQTPFKVVIDEAIEIAKEYGAEKSAQFVNGALAAVVKQLEKTEEREKTEKLEKPKHANRTKTPKTGDSQAHPNPVQ